jgi:hypothetical protein
LAYAELRREANSEKGGFMDHPFAIGPLATANLDRTFWESLEIK